MQEGRLLHRLPTPAMVSVAFWRLKGGSGKEEKSEMVSLEGGQCKSYSLVAPKNTSLSTEEQVLVLLGI